MSPPERDHQVELLGQRGAHDAAAHRLAKQHKRKLAAGGQQQATAWRGSDRWEGVRVGTQLQVGAAFQQQLVCRVDASCHDMMVAKNALHYGKLAAAPAQALHQREAKGLAHSRHDRHLAGNEHGPAYDGEKVGMGVRGATGRETGDAPATPEGKGTAVQNIEQSINATTLTEQVAHMASTMVLILAKKSGTEISMPTADCQRGSRVWLLGSEHLGH